MYKKKLSRGSFEAMTPYITSGKKKSWASAMRLEEALFVSFCLLLEEGLFCFFTYDFDTA